MSKDVHLQAEPKALPVNYLVKMWLAAAVTIQALCYLHAPLSVSRGIRFQVPPR